MCGEMPVHRTIKGFQAAKGALGLLGKLITATSGVDILPDGLCCLMWGGEPLAVIGTLSATVDTTWFYIERLP